jgi:hypothetical protein
MKKTIFLLLLLVAFALPAFSQISLQAGPEIGYAVMVLPSHYTDEYNGLAIEETTIPKFNPLVGLNGRLSFRKHWILGASLQTQWSGANYKLTNLREDSLGTYSSSYQTSQHYMKLCLPLTLGYRFEVGKLRPFFSLGYRLNYVAYGRAKINQTVIDPASPNNNENFTTYIRPFQNESTRPDADRLAGQVMLSLGTEIGNHLGVSLNAAVGKINSLAYGSGYFWPWSLYRDIYATLSWRLWQHNSTPKNAWIKDI